MAVSRANYMDMPTPAATRDTGGISNPFASSSGFQAPASPSPAPSPAPASGSASASNPLMPNQVQPYSWNYSGNNMSLDPTVVNDKVNQWGQNYNNFQAQKDQANYNLA